MPGGLLSVVRLPKKSGVPADAVEMTFAFIVPGSAPVTADMDEVRDNLKAFFQTTPTGFGTSKVRDYLSAAFDAAGVAEIIHYDITSHLGGSAHGAPLRTDVWSLGAVGATTGANEIAACISFRADYGTDAEFAPHARPRARDRGRIFFGPMISGCIGQRPTTLEPFLDSPPRGILAAAAGRLRDSMTGGRNWAVWSRKNSSLSSVTVGWIDDEPDTQRRRGSQPTLRTTF